MALLSLFSLAALAMTVSAPGYGSSDVTHPAASAAPADNVELHGDTGMGPANPYDTQVHFVVHTQDETKGKFPPTGKTVTVEIEQFKFRPDTVRLAVGQTIRWVNKDAVPHTVVSATVEKTRRTTDKEPSGLFESSNLERGDGFEFAVRERGTIPYYCGIHPFMTAVIIAE